MKPKFEFFCIIAFVLIALSSCDETYDGKYDSVDVEEILKSERLLTNYINCLMDEGPCTEDGRDLKEILPDAITTDCSKCTEKQKDGSAKIMHFMWVKFAYFQVIISRIIFISIENRFDDWERLEEKYDEGGKYRMAYLEAKAAEEHNKTANWTSYADQPATLSQM